MGIPRQRLSAFPETTTRVTSTVDSRLPSLPITSVPWGAVSLEPEYGTCGPVSPSSASATRRRAVSGCCSGGIASSSSTGATSLHQPHVAERSPRSSAASFAPRGRNSTFRLVELTEDCGDPEVRALDDLATGRQSHGLAETSRPRTRVEPGVGEGPRAARLAPTESGTVQAVNVPGLGCILGAV